MAQQKKSQRHRSGLKAHRQSVKHNLRNRAIKKAIRLAAKAGVDAAQSKDPKHTESLSKAYSLIDKAAKTGAIHWKSAARKKARLAHRMAKELVGAAAPAPKAAAAK
ncbi:MAG: 30S ribosomal protein S20 [Elusimicrobia bacterium]|nr:30S ribosomal protein S20 [Elusimicrobiota bacterium]